ncbi:MAG: aspartate-semialdehyde dehydrogenase [Parcubacteria group bacterium Gr01-1014_8]|nr:MAG: aspartate-semialdehyde dehydrogenase [Parcubacteria group bacterium Gr01-1014_8]
MNKKIPVGILGATGMVGQQYVHLLEDHPWFEVAYVAASPQSAGHTYKDALKNGWQVHGDIPKNVGSMVVEDVASIEKAVKKCTLVFSAFEMPDKDAIRTYEEEYAKAGMPVFSNASAHRHTNDVPMLIPEINAHHLAIIPAQQKKRGWKKGFIVVKPNCSLQSYLAPIVALQHGGYEISDVLVTTLQAVSGAGYPGVASLDVIDNVIPFIPGEEEKTEVEPIKILGHIKGGTFANFKGINISAQCMRVPVSDGHMACVSVKFRRQRPTIEQVRSTWINFKSEPQELKLPFAPEQPIIYRDEPNRPQPKRDRDNGKGMAVTVGRLRPCSVFDYKFVALSHNTVRGAAGGGILNAELAYKKGYLQNV